MDYQSTSGFPFHPIPGTCRDAPHRKTDSEGQAGSLALERMITALAPIRMQSALKTLRKCPKNTSWISVADNYSDQKLRWRQRASLRLAPLPPAVARSGSLLLAPHCTGWA